MIQDQKSKQDLLADSFNNELTVAHVSGDAIIITDTDGNHVATINNIRAFK